MEVSINCGLFHLAVYVQNIFTKMKLLLQYSTCFVRLNDWSPFGRVVVTTWFANEVLEPTFLS